MFRGKQVFWVGLILFVGTLTLLAFSMGRIGITWDEPLYITSGMVYLDWAFAEKPFRRETLADYWLKEYAHPPLGKLWYGLLARISGGDFFNNLWGARFGAGLAFAAFVALIFWFVQKSAGLFAGLLSSLIFLFLPRVFLDGQLAALDMPMAFAWFATAGAFFLGMERKGYAFLSGIFFGLALLVKVNAFFLPVVLWPWGLIFYRRKALWPILWMLILGPILFVGLWPRMWLGPWEILHGYIQDKLQRKIVTCYYLGRVYSENYPPWHYPFVLTVATVPAGILGGLVVGISRIFRFEKGARRLAQFSLWNLAAILAIQSLPGTPRYDGVRLFLNAFPFLSILGALGLEWIWRRISGRRKSTLALAGVGLVFLVSQFAPAILSFPYNLSYYSASVGWAVGAKRLGFESAYWGEAFNGKIFSYLNEHVPDGGKVSFRAVAHWNLPIYDHLVREDITVLRPGDLRKPDFIVMQVRQGQFSEEDWELYRNEKPVFGNYVFFGQVPVCLIFDRRGK